MKKTLVSGIQPTGDLHIGNYFGAIKQFIDFQNTHDSYIFVADLHALTTVQNKEVLKKNILDVTAAYIACGIDPEKVTLFKQSDIGGEVSELCWMFNCITTIPYLERAHAYKDAMANGKEGSVGLFDYPILMSADILIHDAEVVPVGQDQKQHVEYARDIAQKFNRIWGETFRIPESLIMENVSVVPGTDGRKMSKSYKNTIGLFSSDEDIEKAVMGIVTDSSGDVPENVYAIHKHFRSEAELKEIYESNKGKYKALKEILLEDIKKFISPMREKYETLRANPEKIKEVLRKGSEKAQAKIKDKMIQIKNNVGLA